MHIILSVPIIPYLISFLLPENISPTFMSVYTFNVRINTNLVNVLTNRESTAGVSFDLKCQLITNNILRCYIPESSIYYTSKANYLIVNGFTPSDLNYSHINFTMKFDNIGVTGLNIEKEDIENINSLLMIYDMIGDLLSIGADIEWKEKEFYDLERTIMGMCRTLYKLLNGNNFFKRNYTLSILNQASYSNFRGGKSLNIRKFRSVGECCPNCNRILGMILWTDLFPTTDFTAAMRNSESQMLLDEHYLCSRFNNLFDLFDEKSKFFGRVVENVEVVLLTVDA